MLKGGGWQTFTADPTQINDSGYPKNGVLADDWGVRVVLPDTATTALTSLGDWVIKWTGTGPVDLFFTNSPVGVTVVSGGAFVFSNSGSHMVTQGADGRIVFTWNGDSDDCFVTFKAGKTYTDVGNMVLCRLDHEAAYDAGEIVNPDVVALLQTLAPRILRIGDFPHLNENNNSSEARYRSQLSDFAWTWRAPNGAWVGNISGTDTYTCGASADATTLTHLMCIRGRIQNTNTVAQPTLNFNGTGAKMIVGVDYNNTPFGIGVGNVTSGGTYAGSVTLTYDADLNAGAGAWCLTNGYLRAYVPIEATVAFVNKVNTDMWYGFQHLIQDAFVTEQAEYIAANLNTGLKCYFEYSNEIWNFGGGFNQTRYASEKGVALGFTTNVWMHSFYALRYCQIMGLVATAMAGRSADMQRVIAFQAFGGAAVNDLYRFLGDDLAAYGFDTAPNRPIDRCEVLSYATYYSGAMLQNFDPNYIADFTDLLDAADDYDSGVPAQMTAALDFLDNDFRAGVRNGSLGGQTLLGLDTNIYPKWEPYAVTYSKQIIPYEGSFEGAPPSTARLTTLGISTAYSAKISTLLDAYKDDARFQTLVTDQSNQFMAYAHSECPVWFIMEGPNQWSTHKGIPAYSTTWKSWDAILAL